MASLQVLFLVLCVLTCSNIVVGYKIVGGQNTTISERPYQASLQIHRRNDIRHYCGASIISTKSLLTAAHCYPVDELDRFYARVGSTDYSRGGQELKVKDFIVHPSYNNKNLDYDFAVVTFGSGIEIQLGPNVAVVTMNTRNELDVGSLVTVSGWGATSETDEDFPTVLKEIDLPVVSQQVCEFNYNFLTPRHLCLGGVPQGNMSSCTGDYGGPAVQNSILYAVVSGTRSCQFPNVPGIYSKVSTAWEWIVEVMVV